MLAARALAVLAALEPLNSHGISIEDMSAKLENSNATQRSARNDTADKKL